MKPENTFKQCADVLLSSNYCKNSSLIIQNDKFIDVDLRAKQIKVSVDEQLNCNVAIILADDKLMIMVSKGDENGTQSNNQRY